MEATEQAPFISCDFSLRSWAGGNITIHNRTELPVRYRYTSGPDDERVRKARQGTIDPQASVYFGRIPGFRTFITVGTRTIEVREVSIINQYHVLMRTIPLRREAPKTR